MFSTIATAPAKQSASETISVLSGRLSSATLLEDRRAAILGLRSFAKEYPASVASTALRSLIGSLSKDGDDIDTVKIVLETLIMLFNPNQDSSEASEEIVLWLADEFTQRQENITLLLDFLDSNHNHFYPRLYALQLLSAILSARTERTEECIFSAPLGISRLVAVLDDSREAIRNEALSLIVDLTPTNSEIQKLVAFEGTFDRAFNIIVAEGSLSLGGRVVEDCLILLVNLLRHNSSNQSLFRETGCLRRLSMMLESAYRTGQDDTEAAPWAAEQENRNIYALLCVIRLLVVPGATCTPQNQTALFQQAILHHALQLAFNYATTVPIKAEALETCADIIHGNSSLQPEFAQLQVPGPSDEPSPAPVASHTRRNGVPQAYVIDGLLDLILAIHFPYPFDLRIAACNCLKAYFHHHVDIRLHFLRRAIDGHKSGVDEKTNVLRTLLRSPTEASVVDPYRYWFAAVIMLHLFHENPTAKALAMEVTEGDESSGEEAVTSIQTITAHLLGSLARNDDSRIVVGYLMLLLCWLFEDLDGVNDFLGEGSSNLHGLIQAVLQPNNQDAIVQGLCTMLLGVVYEYSTKDSPISRATLHSVLLSRLGREKYIDKLSALRSHPQMRDFEILPQKLDGAAGQKFPDVFFDATFVDFFKDNCRSIVRAIDRDPSFEIAVVTDGAQKGISRELVDSLRAEVAEKEQALRDAQNTVTSLTRERDQELTEHQRTRESATAEAARSRTLQDELQRKREAEISAIYADQQVREQGILKQVDHIRAESHAMETDFLRQIEQLRAELQNKELDCQRQFDQQQAQHCSREAELQRQIEYTHKQAEAEAERAKRRGEAALADLKATISSLEVDLMKTRQSKTQELEALRVELGKELVELKDKCQSAEESCQALQSLSKGLEESSKSLKQQLGASQEMLQMLKGKLQQTEGEKKSIQNELDDLLLVFGDLEEKKKHYKGRLKALGEKVSEAEEDDEDEDEDDDDNDEKGEDDDADEDRDKEDESE